MKAYTIFHAFADSMLAALTTILFLPVILAIWVKMGLAWEKEMRVCRKIRKTQGEEAYREALAYAERHF